ncbi:discoidin domain-containing protein, partial [Algoriella sp.]|uniref:discoidin domain-containing protein n=1 Tax=Algoriella sp. TaxID=1872434 RepID=UPI001B285845
YNPENNFLKNKGKLQVPQEFIVTDKNKTAYTVTPSWQKVENADYYEIEFEGRNYSYIKDNSLLFENLKAETTYSFKVRAVNKTGVSDWQTVSTKTNSDPLLFAIRGLKGETTAENQPGEEVKAMFDYDEGNMWHTKWSAKAVPFDMIIDLNSVNQLDKLNYLPRISGGNGNIIKGKVYAGMSKDELVEVGHFDWKNDGSTKEFIFTNHPTARYVKITVEDAIGGFGSGRELYIFKVPGTESYIPGDINNDRLIDMNDFTSYTNYTGLRLGDSDFEGYVSNGDVNKNNLIDAFDVSNVAVRMRGGGSKDKIEKVAGKLTISTPKQNYVKDEIIEISVKSTDFKSVNALSFALPYNQSDYEFVSIEPLNIKEMENLTNDRLHTNGVKALYPTFVNIGKKLTLDGTANLFVIKFKAKRNLKFNLVPIDGYLVDKDLNSIHLFKK